MKSKLIVLLVCMLALTSFGSVMAQDALPAVDLVMWTTERDQPIIDAYQNLFDMWAEQNAPGSTIEITYVETEEMRNQLLTAGLAGTGLPDLFLGPNDPIGVFVDAGILQPVDELVDTSVFSAGSLEAATLDGTLYGIPMNAGNHIMLLYNKDLVPEAPQTWAELIEVANQVETDNPDVQGFAYNLNEPFWFVPFVFGFGGKVFNEDGSFALGDQAWVDAYQFVHDLKFSDEIVPAECDYDCANSLFAEGGAAMILNGDWSLGAYLDPEQSPGLGPDKLGIAPWPALENGERPQPFVSGRYISIPVTTEGDKLAAIQSWLGWMASDPEAILVYTADIGRLSAITSASEMPEFADDPLLAASSEALATGTGMPANVELRCMWDAVRPQLEGVMADTTAPADAAAAAQVSAEQCVATLE
jgi:arabinogalactan oligomer / maltooligosaccharide transport system substrate-binding protein